MNAHIETERKFLIAMPRHDALMQREGARCDRILQTYLLSEEGTTWRVRLRESADGHIRYTETKKRRIHALSSVEEEREIGEEQYRALLGRADPACRPIEKLRYTVPHGDLLLEIDVYPFWHRTAVLEVELPSPETPLALPDYLLVLREVSDDVRYKNASLARSVPAE